MFSRKPCFGRKNAAISTLGMSSVGYPRPKTGHVVPCGNSHVQDCFRPVPRGRGMVLPITGETTWPTSDIYSTSPDRKLHRGITVSVRAAIHPTRHRCLESFPQADGVHSGELTHGEGAVEPTWGVGLWRADSSQIDPTAGKAACPQHSLTV